MTVSKGSKTYSIRECTQDWSVFNEDTAVSICYKVDKKLCKTEEELKKYIEENDMF